MAEINIKNIPVSTSVEKAIELSKKDDFSFGHELPKGNTRTEEKKKMSEQKKSDDGVEEKEDYSSYMPEDKTDKVAASKSVHNLMEDKEEEGKLPHTSDIIDKGFEINEKLKKEPSEYFPKSTTSKPLPVKTKINRVERPTNIREVPTETKEKKDEFFNKKNFPDNRNIQTGLNFYEKNDAAQRAGDYLLTSINRAYRDGFFGEEGSKEAKARRDSLIWQEVGNFMFNIGVALTGEGERQESPFGEIMKEHNKAYEERYAQRMKAHSDVYSEDVKNRGEIENYAKSSDFFNSLPEDQKIGVIGIKNILGGSPDMLENGYRAASNALGINFRNAVLTQDYESAIGAILGNNKLLEDINKVRADIGIDEATMSNIIAQTALLFIDARTRGESNETAIKTAKANIGKVMATTDKTKTDRVLGIVGKIFDGLNSIANVGNAVGNIMGAVNN